MKFLFVILFSLFVSISYAYDFATISALIEGHKLQYRNLDDRGKNELVNTGFAFQVTELSEKYDKIKSLMFNANRDVLSYLLFAQDILRASDLSREIVELESDVLSFAAAHLYDYPEIAKIVYDSQKTVFEGTSQLTNITYQMFLAGINVSLATREQRSKYSAYLISTLQYMHYILLKTKNFIEAFNKVDTSVNPEIRLITDEQCQQIMQDILNKPFNKKNIDQ